MCSQNHTHATLRTDRIPTDRLWQDKEREKRRGERTTTRGRNNIWTVGGRDGEYGGGGGGWKGEVAKQEKKWAISEIKRESGERGKSVSHSDGCKALWAAGPIGNFKGLNSHLLYCLPSAALVQSVIILFLLTFTFSPLSVVSNAHSQCFYSLHCTKVPAHSGENDWTSHVEEKKEALVGGLHYLSTLNC